MGENPARPADRFAATPTRAKLEGRFTDTVFSFRATRTIFRPYQFTPVIKLLGSGSLRILIADEVGLWEVEGDWGRLCVHRPSVDLTLD